MSHQHTSIAIENQSYTQNNPKLEDTQSKSSCVQKTQYIVVFSILVWFILSNINIGLGISYMNTPICTRQKNVISNKNNSFNLITNNTYEIQIEEIAPTVNLSIWLIINGYIWQYAIILSIMYALIDKDKIQKNTNDCISSVKSYYIRFFPFIMFLFIFFLFIWMIIGAKSFWSDCGYDINKSIERLMGLTLISEILNIIIFVMWCIYKIFQSIFSCCK